MVKKGVCLVLICIMLISMIGCGSRVAANDEKNVKAELSSTDVPIKNTEQPNAVKTASPTVEPNKKQPAASTAKPTAEPSPKPTAEPTAEPTPTAANRPTAKPTLKPTDNPTTEPTPAPTVKPTNEPTPKPTDEPTPIPDNKDESTTDQSGISLTQRNSINVLNYITFLSQEINDSKDSRVFLETAYSALINNTYPNAVDARTQAQITSLLDTLEGYRMITVKRERLEFIYEQNRAQALRQAIPNPVALLSVVQSGSLLKAAVSVLYMTVDSAAKYSSASSQADMQYLKDGWELDDAEAAVLHNSRKTAFSYMLSMVRDNSLPGDLALNEAAIQNFVSWKNNPNIVRRIAWLETNRETYKAFGPYWLELVKDYYDHEDYRKCLEAIERYESVTTRIFRKDYDYAKVLPMALIAAKMIMGTDEYVSIADRYTEAILQNTGDSDWMLRYFVAQSYLDLCSCTGNRAYIEKAYKVVFDNVNVLVDSQRELNSAYLAPVQEASVGKGATKREKSEVKQYNKLLKAERKIALPPVSEALYLNCDMLFALAQELKINSDEQNRIESILHENGEKIFLSDALDNRFWFSKRSEIKSEDILVSYDGEKLSLPAASITDRSSIVVSVSGKNGKAFFRDWTVESVERPKKAGFDEYTVILSSKESASYKFQSGDIVTVSVMPIQESPEYTFEFVFEVIPVKKALVFNDIEFERKR